MTPAQMLISFWERLRSATTLAVGDAVILEWETLLPANADWIEWRRPMLQSCVSSLQQSQGYAPFVMPTNGITGEAAARAIGTKVLCGTVNAEGVRELGARLDLQNQFPEARAYWSGRVSAFAAAAAAEIAEVSAGVADSVAAISDDLEILNETVQVISTYVDMPEEVRAAVDTNLAGIRERRKQDIANIRAMADTLREIEFDVRAGDIGAFDPVGVVESSGVSPLVVVGGLGALFALLKGG